MRIIAGEAKGRRLRTVKGSKVRPTADRVREAMFNIIGDRVINADVLDLFAGTGALGLEALSRGARTAVFVEHDRQVLQTLYANIELLGYGARCRVLREDVQKFISKQTQRLEQTLLFADPPYRSGAAAWLLPRLPALMQEHALFVLEHSVDEQPPTRFASGAAGIVCIDRRRYGDVMVSFYQRDAAPEDEGAP